MTREEFKARWESGDDGGGITLGDIAECAREWGFASYPQTMCMEEVVCMVLKEAGISDAEGITERMFVVIGGGDMFYDYGDPDAMEACALENRVEDDWPPDHKRLAVSKALVASATFHCLDCGSRLVKRSGRFGEFLGCSDFPRCTFSVSIIGDGEQDRAEKALDKYLADADLCVGGVDGYGSFRR